MHEFRVRASLSKAGPGGLVSLRLRIAFVANVLGDLLLCPKYGAFGAAVATDVATSPGRSSQI